MDKLVDRLLRRYFRKKKRSSSGTWRESYYAFLESCSVGRKWKDRYREKFLRKLEKGEYVQPNRLQKKLYYLKFRLQSALYGVRFDEFFIYGFFNKPFTFPSKWMTLLRFSWMDHYLNDKEQKYYTDNKLKFAEFIGTEDYGRRWADGACSLRDFRKTFQGCGRLIVKPLERYGGKGIGVYELEGKKPAAVYQAIHRKYKMAFIIEEYYEQKGFMHDLNPSSLNTIRVITIREPGTDRVHIVDGYARVGVPGSVVDNYSRGGVRYPIEPGSGRLGTANKKDKVYGTLKEHPGAGRSYTGLIIPYWQEICGKCIEWQNLLPEKLNYIGWDVCLSDDRIIVIEANTWAGFGPPYESRDNRWSEIESILDSAAHD